jgi:hypothetical protein
MFLTSRASLALRYRVSTVHVLFRCWIRCDLGFGRGRVHFLGRKFPSQGCSLGSVGCCGWGFSGGMYRGWVLPAVPGVGCSPRWGSGLSVFSPSWLVAGRRQRRQLVCCSSMVRLACRHCLACREESLRLWPLPKIFFGLFVVILFWSFWLGRRCAGQRVS